MRTNFAIWEESSALYFDEDGLRELGDHGVGLYNGTPAELHVFPDGEVRLVPNSSNHYLFPSSQYDTMPYLLSGTYDYEGRCQTMPLSLRWVNWCWRAQLPPVYELPWPTYRQYAVGPFDKHAAALREIRLRLAACPTDLAVPAHIQQLLTAEERVSLFNRREL